MSTAVSPPPVVLGPELAGTLMTPEEFDAIDDAEEGYRYELIRGVLIVSPPPSIEERSPNDYLGYLFFTYKEHHPLGSALDWTAPEQTLYLKNRRLADRVVWAGLGRRPDPKADVPAIVIEFVSERKRDRTRDYETKRREYLRAGVQEYWIIDRFRRTLTAIVRHAGQARSREVVVPADVVDRTPLLPGFELPLGRLLAVSGGWA